jgi:hypothetical protein
VRNFYLHWCIYGFLFGIFIGANNIGHAGGLIAGLALGIPLAESYVRVRLKIVLQVAGILCLLPWLISLGYLFHSIWTNT